MLGLLGALSWTEFGDLRGGRPIHYWEFFHHYLGSKYSLELGYTQLYHCTIIADALAGTPPPASAPVRSLSSKTVEPAAVALADPIGCTKHFSPGRWRAFRHDVAFFRDHLSKSRWDQILTDHGYNATPVWGLVGSVLSNTGPASETQMAWLAALDPVLLLLMWGFVVWAFGPRTACVALVFFGTNYFGRFAWTGGAFLRQDWLVTSVIAVCLVRRNRMVAGGALLTLATLLRIFPGFLVATLIGAVAVSKWRSRMLRVAVPLRRFTAGSIATLVVLVPLSAQVGGGRDAWAGFVANSRSHLATPLGNFVGWRPLVAFDPATRARDMFDASRLAPFEPWQQARLETFAERSGWFWLGLTAFVVLVLFAASRREPWEALVLGVGLIVMGAQVGSYYYAILLLYALLWPARPVAVIGLCLLAAVSRALPLVVREQPADELFAWESLAVVVYVFAATALCLGRAPAPAVDAPQREAASDPTT